ncbi:glycerophosphodiester phosphodiesterase family protein [Erythrobacter rubeus]|uniref:Glycerophosphodiester phosphodiesterase n=1 Tax=Erythrobacter rubeus TaxID=2760803 RepID=A0ABR8KRP6_9SPHN|nr:glycerophosphodiester phosphodiesterase family protein [Erythrobacter rubeus]MBD2843414.1 glycerophosphodiester phosphodiesterase [Erythrobacter rubeus]
MSERRVFDWLTKWEYAHRGLHDTSSYGLRIENSRSAFAAAIEAGMGIECDVQLSRDKVAMVFHDWVLERLTDGSGFVAAHDAAALRHMHLTETGDRMESLEDLLAQIDERVPLLVEIKSMPDFTIEEACAAVSNALGGYDGNVAVMSFDPRCGEWFAAHDPDRIRGLVCTDTLDHGWLSAWRTEGAIARADPDFLAVDIRDLPNNLASEWRGEDRPLLSWTISTADRREKALKNVDALISEGEGLP